MIGAGPIRWPIRGALAAALFALVPAATSLAQQAAPRAPRPYDNNAYGNDNATYAQPYAMRSAQLDRTVTQPFPNGCRYVATVRGTMVMMPGPPNDQQVSPQLSVAAQVVCPNGQGALSTNDTLTNNAPMPYEQLEDSIDRRGTVYLDAAAQRCIYSPIFDIEPDGDVRLENVNVTCSQPGRVHRHHAYAPNVTPAPQPARRVR